ncbi:MAG: S8 family serine peptidase [Flavobacteriales bacterium]|nr:S8 family serine peptidase [Flavobacteriales bacterium]
MVKRLFIVFLFLCIFLNIGEVKCQPTAEYHHYLVLFKDKGLRYTSFRDSLKFLTPEALDRRKRFHIGLDSFDLPVTKAYLDNIRSADVRVLYATRWLNGAVIRVKNHDAARILRIKFFVDQVTYLGSAKISGDRQLRIEDPDELNSDPASVPFDVNAYGQAADQLKMTAIDKIHASGYWGEGIRVAVLDAGFRKVNSLSAFKHLRTEKEIRVWDLVDFDGEVYTDDAHGMHVLGCMAAWAPKEYSGSAPAAEYFLFRTENSATETLLEELNWVRAAEIADSLGIDIINSSLGYTTFDEPLPPHSRDDLDGQTTYIAKAAQIAVSRGILVVNSAGNDGNKSWRKLNSPADVEEVVSVGSVDAKLNPSPFTSSGPTADGRMKPDVCALGSSTVLIATYGGVYRSNGTSYSTPIIAGVGACLMEKHPEVTPIELRLALIFSSSRFSNPDTLLGSGIPNAYFASLALGADLGRESAVVESPKNINCPDCNLSIYSPSEVKHPLYLSIYSCRKFIFFKYYKYEGSQYFRRMGNLARLTLNNIDNSRDIRLKAGPHKKIKPRAKAWLDMEFPAQ